MEKEEIIFTGIPLDLLTERLIEKLRPVVTEAVAAQMPDQIITVSEAAKILGRTKGTVAYYANHGILTNLGTGKQRPKLSKREVVELKKEVQNRKNLRA